mgnify:CR=1 FL=1
MSFAADLHVHTIASGHAYSTLMDYVRFAKEHHITLIGLSDHGPAMPGGPHLFHLGNQTVIPRSVEGVAILRGAEANIVNFLGDLDINQRIASRLDYMIVSLHDVVLNPGSTDEHTQAVLGAMKHEKVRILGHLGNPSFPLNYEAVMTSCLKHNVAIEINNSSFRQGSRAGSEKNCIEIAKRAFEMNVPLIFSSDAHIHTDLGNFEHGHKMFEALGIPLEYVLNYNQDRFYNWLGNIL